MTVVNRVLDLSVSKTASQSTVVAGQPLTYTITVTNIGPATLNPADNITLTDVLPAGFTGAVYTAAGGTYTSATGNWTGLTLASGQSTTLSISGTVSATSSGSLTNTVTVAVPAGTTDPNTANNSASVTTPVSRVMDFEVTKVATLLQR